MSTFEKALAAFNQSRREGRNMPKLAEDVDKVLDLDRLKGEVEGRD